MARVTLQTIADQVGVSKQTVSNAFSRPDQLSPALRDQILAIADQLGYLGPDPSAQALSRGRTGIVGVVLTERSADALADPAATEFLIGVAEALEITGRSMLMISGRPDGPTIGSAIAQAPVDALLMYSLAPEDEHVRAALARDLPLVTVDQPLLDHHPHVGIDQYEAGRLIGAHLEDLGHRRIALLTLRIHRDGVSGPVDTARWTGADFPLTVARADGLASSGPDIALTWECPDRDPVAAAVDQILNDPTVTAIAAMSDDFAIAAIDHLARRGVRVPEEMSVTGIDNIPYAATLGLTTIHQDHRGKGRAAIAMLEDPTTVVGLDCRLVKRNSTAPPGSGINRAERS